MEKTVVALSGGLDSTVLTHKLVKDYGKENVIAFSANYAQRHDVELELAKRTTKLLGIEHVILDMNFLGKLTCNVSSMVKGKVATPDAAEDDMPSSYVPFRNAIFTTIAASIAESKGAHLIALGLNVDQPDNTAHPYRYWDITPEFYETIGKVLLLNPKHPIKMIAPFLNLSKADEITLGVEMNVDFGNSWTCYNPVITPIKGHEREPAGGWNTAITMKHYQPCGICPSCSERAAAFKKVGLVDPVDEHGVFC